MGHPPRIPVWLPLEHEVIYFVTLNVAERRRVLANDAAFAAWILAISEISHWTVLAGVMMPDHIHFLVYPHERDADVGEFSGLTKRLIRRRAKRNWRWQPGSFDRLLRGEESAQEKWVYIRENPVRAGLVERWQDWPYKIGF
jgi:REP element-mobilizing transposase RayT